MLETSKLKRLNRSFFETNDDERTHAIQGARLAFPSARVGSLHLTVLRKVPTGLDCGLYPKLYLYCTLYGTLGRL